MSELEGLIGKLVRLSPSNNRNLTWEMIPRYRSSAAYEEFVRLWSQGSFKHQRLGQAFYNHFNLNKLTDQVGLHNLYEGDGVKASRLISRLFHLH